MIAVTIHGDRALTDRLSSLPSRLRPRLTLTVQRLSDDLRNRVEANLAGAVLQSRSGRLASHLVLDLEPDGQGIAGRVGIDTAEIPYAAFQEYGFRGTETVRAHLRTITKAFGRSIAQRQVSVRSYERAVDYPAHSFLRSAFAEIAPEAVSQIGEAVAEAVAES